METGTLISWDDAKGYGFVRPHNEKAEIFLHVREVRHYQRRPKIGDVLTYKVCTDEQDRYYAGEAKIKGFAWSRVTMIWMLLILLCGGYLLLAFRQTLPFHPLAIYGVMSLFTIWLYHRDKRAAQSGTWRTRERTLHLFELLGGWPGALLAQIFYRHKVRKISYQLVFWLIVAAHGFLWYHVLTHRELYWSYQQIAKATIQSFIGKAAEETEQFVKGDAPEETLPTGPQTGPRSTIKPSKQAQIVPGIVKEIRPDEGVIVSLQSEAGSEGIIARSTLVSNFPSRFTIGERVQVAVQTITIEGQHKRIELVLVEE